MRTLALVLLGCTTTKPDTDEDDPDSQDDPAGDTDSDAESDTDPETPPDWVPDGSGPWEGRIAVATSEDTLAFDAPEVFLEHAGVPNALRTPDGDLLVSYQYFSYEDESLFNVMAYSLSEDDGTSWDGPRAFGITGLPEGGGDPVDPTLVYAGDRYRLYFTYDGPDAAVPELASAAGTSLDALEYEGVRIGIEGQFLLDPSLVLYQDLWHWYTWKVDGAVVDGKQPYYHATSTDGLTFTEPEEGMFEMGFLGNPISMGDRIRYYGTGLALDVPSATSTDGVNWTADAGSRLSGYVEGAPVFRGDGSMLLFASEPAEPSE